MTYSCTVDNKIMAGKPMIARDVDVANSRIEPSRMQIMTLQNPK